MGFVGKAFFCDRSGFFLEKRIAKTQYLRMMLGMIRRVFVEEKNGHSSTALLEDLRGNLNTEIPSMRVLQRYDIEGIDDAQFAAVV